MSRTADVGFIEEKITQIAQLFSTELHILKIIKKYNSKLDNVDLKEEDLEDIDFNLALAMELLEDATQARRASQKLLVEYIENHSDLVVNKNYWCVFKHMTGAEMCAFESLQALETNDKMFFDFEQDLIRVSKLFTKITSVFLGTDITDCVSCLSDMLKGGEK